MCIQWLITNVKLINFSVQGCVLTFYYCPQCLSSAMQKLAAAGGAIIIRHQILPAQTD